MQDFREYRILVNNLKNFFKNIYFRISSIKPYIFTSFNNYFRNTFWIFPKRLSIEIASELSSNGFLQENSPRSNSCGMNEKYSEKWDVTEGFSDVFKAVSEGLKCVTWAPSGFSVTFKDVSEDSQVGSGGVFGGSGVLWLITYGARGCFRGVSESFQDVWDNFQRFSEV